MPLHTLDLSAPIQRGKAGGAAVRASLDWWSASFQGDHAVKLRLTVRYKRRSLFGRICESAFGTDCTAIEALAAALPKAPLERLDLSRHYALGQPPVTSRRSNCSGADTLLLAAAAGAMPALVELRLAGCSIGSADAIARWLEAGAPALTCLDLAANYLGPADAALLGASLLGAPRLQVLVLDCNRLGPQGGLRLSAALQSHPHPGLRGLHLCRNGLASAASDVLMALHDGAAPHLVELTLGWNGIGELGDCTRSLEVIRRVALAQCPAAGATSRAWRIFLGGNAPEMLEALRDAARTLEGDKRILDLGDEDHSAYPPTHPLHFARRCESALPSGTHAAGVRRPYTIEHRMEGAPPPGPRTDDYAHADNERWYWDPELRERVQASRLYLRQHEATRRAAKAQTKLAAAEQALEAAETARQEARARVDAARARAHQAAVAAAATESAWMGVREALRGRLEEDHRERYSAIGDPYARDV